MISTDEFTRTYTPGFYFYYITEVLSKPEDQRPKGLALALDYHEYLHRTIGHAYKPQTPKQTNMRKVVINRCYGGFDLSKEALKQLGIECDSDIGRDDPRLVEVVERLGDEAETAFSQLLVVEIPDDMPFYIQDDEGFETIHEQHRIFPTL